MKEITLSQHMSRIAKLKTPSQQLARKTNITLARRCAVLRATGMTKEDALLTARREAAEVPTEKL